jgi:hypothetical protein
MLYYYLAIMMTRLILIKANMMISVHFLSDIFVAMDETRLASLI